ncbi:hypothetical protein DSL72_003419 [Monilinia vaccinii-corymbosi]|uniref:Modin n=1 Tax=Monilinia vaccinii-corymbosi TaxID=61207 RepID=A0A8A3NTY1_9HELO|nr:hypothetical protein DSL72_003419 [Monilinia vaccinii-corymbosi]
MSGFDQLSQNVFGLVALVISVIALLTTCLQVLQQYFSSAEGYRRCAESVMGPWNKGTHRKLNMKEFRVEVVFETPVIFIASPTNIRGPIMDKPIFYLDGSKKSCDETMVLEPDEQVKMDKEAVQRVHTADDERASWVTLLSNLQKKERDSRVWDLGRRLLRAPMGANALIKAPTYELAVGLQVKTRSWDFVPPSITRPYATSAICHLVEMMALMGMYWKVFDQIQWNLRAEGNGFILTSTTVHGLGVMVTFAVTGRSKFEENRVIPSGHIKDLCFGTVPNIFEEDSYLKEDPESQSLSLKFGSQEDVELTLESLGFSFEIIGMLGKVVRLRGSSFRMIPNPTQDHWLKKTGKKPAWTITKLMAVFQEKLVGLSEHESDAEKYTKKQKISMITERWQEIMALGCIDEYNLSIEAREKIHDALDGMTDFLLETRQADVLEVLVAHLDEVTQVLVVTNSPLNSIVSAHKEEPLLDYYFDTILPKVVGTAVGPEKEKRRLIWVCLMFRMLCWFLLHDWSKDDKCGVPPDLKGSRMPVFIG